MLYNIYAGLGGGFGGATYQGTADCKNIEEAEELAKDYAYEEYDSYEGLHGLLTQEEAEQQAIEDGIDPDTTAFDRYIDQLFDEDREQWIEYWAVPMDEDVEIEEDDIDFI